MSVAFIFLNCIACFVIGVAAGYRFAREHPAAPKTIDHMSLVNDMRLNASMIASNARKNAGYGNSQSCIYQMEQCKAILDEADRLESKLLK